MKPTQRVILGFLFLGLLTGWGAISTARVHPRQDDAPKLVVVLIIDGLPPGQIGQNAARLGEDGFRRLMSHGAWFTGAQYGHSTTVTGAGHATILSGAYPYRHGVVGNDWFDPRTKKRVYCAEDSSSTYLGEPTKEHAGTSPRNLLVTTIGDELRLASGFKSRVFATSLKDRGAILPAGKLGGAYFYSSATGRFITSSYYRKDYPEWCRRFHETAPQDRWFGTEWKPLDPGEPAGEERAHVPNYKGLGKTFPHRITGGKDQVGPDYYAALAATPFGYDHLLDFTEALIRGEKLGRNPDGATDLLAISFSSHDLVNHVFGPESPESRDDLVRLDRALARLFKSLDESAGADQTLSVLTADHGFPYSPEYYRDVVKLDAGRIDHDDMVKQLNRRLSEKFGEGAYVLSWWLPNVYLDGAPIEEKKLDRSEVERQAALFLSGYPGVHTVLTRTQLLSGQVPPTRLGLLASRAWHPQVSGDLLVLQRDGWFLADKDSAYAAMHGAPWTYDTRVPLAFLGRKWIRPGRYAQAVEPTDIAPTLAHLLDVPPPTGSEGRALAEILVRER